MNMASTQYSLDTESFEIYLSGCNGKCKGCHNPELKDFSLGVPLSPLVLEDIIKKIKRFDTLIKHVWILGGEPLNQNHDEVISLIRGLKIANKNIWLWTRYEIQQIPTGIKNLCDYIKCGEYKEDLKTENNIQYGIKLATSNQKIYIKGEF